MKRNHHVKRMPADKMLPKNPSWYIWLQNWPPCAKAKKDVKHLHNRKSRRWLKSQLYNEVKHL